MYNSKREFLGNLMSVELNIPGIFNNKPRAALIGIIGATGAAMVIYPSIIGAWYYVGLMGICYFSAGDRQALTISGIITVFL